MTDTERIILKLVKAGIWRTDPAGIECNDWQSVISTAQKMSVMPIVAERILNMNPRNLDAKDAELLTNAVMDAIYTSDMVSTTIVEVFSRLEAAGMEPVLLKGHSNAANYPDPHLRPCGDIDIYVGEERYEEAGLMFGEKEDPSVRIKHSHGKLNGIGLEFHRTSALMHRKRMDRIYLEQENKYIRQDSITILGRKITVPDPTFNAFFLFYHAWYHLLRGGIGIKHFCDVTLFMDRHSQQIDRKRLKGMIETAGLMYEWRFMMCVCTDVFGLDESKVPFFKKTPQWKSRYLMSLMFKEGYFGHYGKKACKRTVLIKKAHNFLLETIRYAKMFPLFPGATLKGYCRYLISKFFWHIFGITIFQGR